jgi:hypothetical protein
MMTFSNYNWWQLYLKGPIQFGAKEKAVAAWQWHRGQQDGGIQIDS